MTFKEKSGAEGWAPLPRSVDRTLCPYVGRAAQDGRPAGPQGSCCPHVVPRRRGGVPCPAPSPGGPQPGLSSRSLGLLVKRSRDAHPQAWVGGECHSLNRHFGGGAAWRQGHSGLVAFLRPRSGEMALLRFAVSVGDPAAGPPDSEGRGRSWSRPSLPLCHLAVRGDRGAERGERDLTAPVLQARCARRWQQCGERRALGVRLWPWAHSGVRPGAGAPSACQTQSGVRAPGTASGVPLFPGCG